MLLDKTHVSLLTQEQWLGLAKDAGFTVERAGTDTLWDFPYTNHIPVLLQKIVLAPLNMFFYRWIGLFPWKLGENTIVILNAPSP